MKKTISKYKVLSSNLLEILISILVEEDKDNFQIENHK